MKDCFILLTQTFLTGFTSDSHFENNRVTKRYALKAQFCVAADNSMRSNLSFSRISLSVKFNESAAREI